MTDCVTSQHTCHSISEPRDRVNNTLQILLLGFKIRLEKCVTTIFDTHYKLYHQLERTIIMAKIWFLLGLLFLLLAHLLGIHIDFERTEQLTGFDVYGSTLRVRKYNRTTIF